MKYVPRLIFILFFLYSILTAAQKKISAFQINSDLTIDGILSSNEWVAIDSATDFIQLEPEKGASASEKTIVYVMYNSEYLYIGFKCFDRQPESIVANLQLRDNLDKNDDAVFVILDTFLDQRSGFAFFVNPISTQTDMRIADDGRSTDINWDIHWKAAAKKSQFGWTAEIAIPFSNLSYDAELQEWGINFGRIIRKNSETVYWSGIMNSDYRISQGGTLVNLELPYKKRSFTFTPYSTLRYEGSDLTVSNNEVYNDIGADLAYHITSNLITNLTLNPDFASVEGDQEKINLSRWELSFPEKRLFFLEGNELYSTRIRTFYSRRIGDIDYGGKFVGKVGDYTISAMGVKSTQDINEHLPAAVFSIMRLKKDILKSSTVGITYAGKDWDGGYARSISADYVLNLGNSWKLTGQFVTSSPGKFWQSSAYFIRFARESNIYHYHIRYSDTGKNFRDNVNHTGFVRDDDMQEIDSDVSYKWWFNRSIFKYINVETRNNIFWNHQGTLRSWYVTESARFYLNNRFSLDLTYNNEFKLYEKKYYNHIYEIELGYNTDEWSSAELEYSWGRNYDRDFSLLESRIRFRPLKKLAMEYEFNKITYTPDFTSNSTTINILTVDYNFTRDLWIRILAQNNIGEKRIYFYGLFGWRFQPPFGALYFIYTADEYTPLPSIIKGKNQIVFLKLSYQIGF